ncbi:MAG: DUF4363 family protein [Ruminococcus sp.]|nr:DUF4363 family protein [Ruminococcus sp.]
MTVITRIKISICILCVMIATSIFSAVWVNSKCTDMIQEINVICRLLDNGNSDEALNRAEIFDTNWHDFRNKATIILKNDLLTDIDCISAGIPYLIRNGDGESYNQLIQLQHVISTLRNSEIPSFPRVF